MSSTMYFSPRPIEESVDPLAVQIRERRPIALRRQTLGLEPAHLRRGCGLTIDGTVADHLPHHRVMGQPLGVVDVFVPGKATIDGLPEQPAQLVHPVRTGPGVNQRSARQIGQAEGVVQFSNDQQTTVRTELRSPELQPHATVKIQPQIVPRTCTRWVSHETRPSCRSTC